jgi:hypothetical protein
MVFDPERQLRVAGEELTANEQLLDALLRHQIGLLRLAGGIRNRVLALLDATEKDARQLIVEASRRSLGFDRPAQVRRLERLLREMAIVRGDAWRDVRELWREEFFRLAVQEARSFDGLLKTVVPVDLQTVLPNARRLRAIVTTQPFEGRVLRDWARSIQRADRERIEAQIRIGLTQGESGQQVARRVVGTARLRGTDGVTEITRRHAAGITRTATNAIANQSRREYFEENSALVERELFVATLDSRTTRICASLDGRIEDVGELPTPRS